MVRGHGIQIVANDELICSCNVCGASNYKGGLSGIGSGPVEPSGLQLWRISWSPNGFHTFVTKTCLACMSALYARLGDVIREQGDAALQNARRWAAQRSSVVDSQETDADPEHNVSPTRER